jgi:DNA-binding protein H-NS
MKKKDLDALSLDELKVLRKDVEKAIADYKDRQLEKARQEVEALARKHGYSLTEITGGGTTRKRKPAAPKYAHPENPALTWSGRGRRPGWVNEALDAGKSLDDLKIGK